MHRSGTSLLAGLLNKMGLDVGPPQYLIQPSYDNKLGFFERLDLVLQNDAIFRNQNVDWSWGTSSFDYKRGLLDMLTGIFPKTKEEGGMFKEGARTLQFLNSVPKGSTWLLKDPRLCISLRSWLPLLPSLPAIVFSYRHPLQVAESLLTREQFPLLRGLKVWISYNRAAIQNSQGLCRVVTSNQALMRDGKGEMGRIGQELRSHCGVAVPHDISPKDLSTFIQPSLQHKSNATTTVASGSGSECGWSEEEMGKFRFNNEKMIFKAAIKLYCAIEDRSAFLPDFQFPPVKDI